MTQVLTTRRLGHDWGTLTDWPLVPYQRACVHTAQCRMTPVYARDAHRGRWWPGGPRHTHNTRYNHFLDTSTDTDTRKDFLTSPLHNQDILNTTWSLEMVNCSGKYYNWKPFVLSPNYIIESKTHAIFTKRSQFAGFLQKNGNRKGWGWRSMSCPAWNINSGVNKYFPTGMAVKYFRWNISDYSLLIV